MGFNRTFLVRLAYAAVVFLGGAGAGAVLGVGKAQANVEFARMTSEKCSACHVGDRTPTSQTLNKTGDAFAACNLDDACIRAWRASLEPRPVPPPPPPAPALPSGSYRASCDTIRMVDGNLLANCRSADQAMRPTSLVRPFACPNGVTNADGHLACSNTSSPVALPIGSYAHSCRDIRIVDDVLFAICKRSDQSTRASSLPRPFACVGGVANVDGRLTCPAQAAAPQVTVVWGAIAAADGRDDPAGIVDRSGAGAGATREDAEANALAKCGGIGMGCKIKVSFQGGCGAYASSHKHSGSGIGQSVAVAQQQAVNDCSKNSCRVAVQFCTGG